MSLKDYHSPKEGHDNKMGMKNEDSTFPKRLKRYAQVSGAVTGIAAKMGGAKLRGKSLNDEEYAQFLVGWLGSLKGPLIKVAQLVSMIPDFLPPAYAQELAALQSDAPAMGRLFVKRRLRNELGDEWADKFADFDLQACHAASLGQVHKAVSLKGETLACKLQYPNMAAVVDADLAQLKMVLKLYDKFETTIDHKEILAEIVQHLLLELDYEKEAQNMCLFREMLRQEKNVRLPIPVPSLSTKRFLTMSWEEGEQLLAYKNSALDLRNIMARNLFRGWYLPFYQYGILHGDPHMGNYRTTPEGDIIIYDFGCVRTFTPVFMSGVIDLYHSLLHNKPTLAKQAYEKWGFSQLTGDLIEALNLWARYLYGPLLQDKVRPIEDSFSSQKGRDVAREVHALLKRQGGITPPREFVFVDRAAVGLGSVFMHLQAQLNWHQLFEELIQDFCEGRLKEAQEKLLAP